ncbi:MAG: ribonuclease T2 [Devosia sp.]|nr:ribonuclease T2 [Devosia sp.]
MNPRFSLAIVAVLLGLGSAFLLLQPPTAHIPRATAPAEPAETPAPERRTRPAESDAFFILAVSWQPAFCESAPGKPECRSQSRDRFDASHFTLHGLWPEDQYCDVSARDEATDRDGRWSALPAPDLSAALRRDLETAMPGTLSQLDRHEWIKHGTCFPGDAEAYFAASLALLDQLNASPVRELFAANIGKRLTQRQIRAAFDTGFGAGTGDSVRIACDDDGDRTLVTELTLGLWGIIDTAPDLATLLEAANPTRGGCEAGIIDPVGLQ